MNSSGNRHFTNNTGSVRGDISSWVAFFGIASILVIALIILSPALNIGFVNEDFYYTMAPPLNGPSDLPAVFKFMKARSVRVLSQKFYYSVGRALWDLDPVRWHADNFILFCIATSVLYLMIASLHKNRLAALIGAGIFAFSGALFYPEVWITGSVEFFAATFVFLSFMFHVIARENPESHSRVILFESLAVLMFALAFVSKETSLPLAGVVVLYDLMATKRISVGSIVFIVCTIIALIISYHYLSLREQHNAYSITRNPVMLAFNFIAYFFDPIMATSGDHFLLDKLGISGNREAAVGDILEILKNNPALIIGFILSALVIGIFWFRFTLIKIDNPQTKYKLHPIFGWLAWFSMLIPALIIPGHHNPYYVVMPFGFLMTTIGPAITEYIKLPRWRHIVITGLLLYAIWFPINTHLAFKLSPLTIRAKLAEEFKQNLDSIYTSIPSGSVVLVDNINNDLDVAILHGKSFQVWYPGVYGMTFADLHSWLSDPVGWTVPKDINLIVVRVERNGVEDVTPQFTESLKKTAEMQALKKSNP